MGETHAPKPADTPAGFLEPSLAVTREEGRVVLATKKIQLRVQLVLALLVAAAMVYWVWQGGGSRASGVCPMMVVFVVIAGQLRLFSARRIELSREGVAVMTGGPLRRNRRVLKVEGESAKVVVEAAAYATNPGDDDGQNGDDRLRVVLIMSGVKYVVVDGCTLADGLLVASEVEGYFGLGGMEQGPGAQVEQLTRDDVKLLASRYLVAGPAMEGAEDLCPLPVSLGESVQSHRVRSGHASDYGWVSFRWLNVWPQVLGLAGLTAGTCLVLGVTVILLGFFHPLIHLLLPVYLVLGWGAYRWVAGLCNKTVYKVYRDRLEMRHGPVWFPGALVVKRERVKDVVVRRVRFSGAGAEGLANRASLGLRMVDGTHQELEKERMTGEEVVDVAGLLAGAMGVNTWVTAQMEPAEGLGRRGRDVLGVYVKEGEISTQVLVKKRLGREAARLWVTGIASSLLVLVEAVFVLSSTMPVWLQSLTVGLGMCVGLAVFYAELVKQANYLRFELGDSEIRMDETPFKWFGRSRMPVDGLHAVDVTEWAGRIGVRLSYQPEKDVGMVVLSSVEQATELAVLIRRRYGQLERAQDLQKHSMDLAQEYLERETGPLLARRVRMRLLPTEPESARQVPGLSVAATTEKVSLEVHKYKSQGIKEGLIRAMIMGASGAVSLGCLFIAEKVSVVPWMVGGLAGLVSLGFGMGLVEWALGRIQMEASFEEIKIKSGFWFYRTVQRLDPAGVDKVELSTQPDLGGWDLEALMHDGSRVEFDQVGVNEAQVRAMGGVLIWFYGWEEEKDKAGTQQKTEEPS